MSKIVATCCSNALYVKVSPCASLQSVVNISKILETHFYKKKKKKIYKKILNFFLKKF